MEKKRSRTLLLVVVLGITAAFGLAACGDGDDDEAAGTSTTGGPEADVTVLLSEFIVEPDPAETAAGEVTILADNQGGETHELVIARGDDPAALPTDENGAVDEAALPAGALIGEIEEFPAQEQRTATFTLDAGSYVLFCNITETEDDGTVESHFVEGMRAVLTVT